jgi:hypothetical protein
MEKGGLQSVTKNGKRAFPLLERATFDQRTLRFFEATPRE